MKAIQRFSFEVFHCNGGEMEASKDGDYVTYEDHAAIVTEQDAVIAQRNAECDRLILEKEALQEQVQKLAAENNAKSNCLSFFASVIKCGEPWTETCQREYDAAFEFVQAPEMEFSEGFMEKAWEQNKDSTHE